MKMFNYFRFKSVLFVLLVATAAVLAGCGAIMGPFNSVDTTGTKIETTTTVPQPIDEMTIPVSSVLSNPTRSLNGSKALTGMTVIARSFDKTTRIQQGTDRTLAETPASSGIYTGSVSVGDGVTSSEYFIHVFGTIGGSVVQQGTLPNYTRGSGTATVICSTGYNVGDFGPTGGMIVSSDKTNKLYTELAPPAWNGGTDPAYTWSRNLTNVTTSTAIREGANNVTAIKAGVSDTWTKVTGATLVASGTGYTATNTLTLQGGDNNTTFTVNTIKAGIASAAIDVKGSGYTANDNLTLTNGILNDGQVKVSAINNGVITAAAFPTANSGFTAQPSPATATTGTSTGTPWGGKNYTQYDTITLGAVAGGGGQVSVSSVIDGVVVTVRCVTQGKGYTVGDLINLPGNLANTAKVQVDSITGTGSNVGKVNTFHLYSLGSGYSAQTAVAGSGGSGTVNATWTTTISNGVISGITSTPVAGGYGYAAGINYAASSGGTGTGGHAQVSSIVDGVISALSGTIVAAGTDYTAGTSYFVSGGTGLNAKVIASTVTATGPVKTGTLGTGGTSYTVGGPYSTTVSPAGGSGATVNVTSIGTYTSAISKFRSAVSFNNHSDWTFPTKLDLDAVGGLNASQRTAIGLTAANVYWSSSQNTTTSQAFALTIGSAACTAVDKQTVGYYVRPVRYF